MILRAVSHSITPQAWEHRPEAVLRTSLLPFLFQSFNIAHPPGIALPAVS